MASLLATALAPLADTAAVTKPVDAQPVQRQPGFGDDFTRFVLEPAECGLEPGERVTDFSISLPDHRVTRLTVAIVIE